MNVIKSRLNSIMYDLDRWEDGRKYVNERCLSLEQKNKTKTELLKNVEPYLIQTLHRAKKNCRKLSDSGDNGMCWTHEVEPIEQLLKQINEVIKENDNATN